MSVRILTGDVRERLKDLADESVHCVVTSPPYWGLRDYGVVGQLGMERTLGEHIDTMANVFDEVWRVLRKDGTLWLNYGDSYAATVNGRSAADTKAAGNDDRTFRDKPFSTIGAVYDPAGGQVPDSKNLKARTGQSGNKGNGGSDFGGRIRAGGFLKAKDLCGIPWRVAFALQERGWYLRQDIIWAKPNPMPESVRDRCTKAHEYLFLLSKSERYFYDAEAISEPVTDSTVARLSQPTLEQQAGSDRVPGKTNGTMKAVGRAAGNKSHKYVDAYDGSDTEGHRTKAGLMKIAGTAYANRNRRSVWTIATQPFAEAHFATFPPELPELCIKAGTSERGCCPKCGAGWVRDQQAIADDRQPYATVGTGEKATGAGRADGSTAKGIRKVLREDGRGGDLATIRRVTIGWRPSCSCYPPLDDAPACFVPRLDPAVVLDPFGGAGTTGMVADRLGRDAIMIELNPEYVSIAERRLHGDAGMFAQVAAE